MGPLKGEQGNEVLLTVVAWESKREGGLGDQGDFSLNLSAKEGGGWFPRGLGTPALAWRYLFPFLVSLPA